MARNEGPVDLVVVDHLGLFTPDQRFRQKNEELGHYSRQMKLLASETKIPILCPHQINRGGEEEAEKTGRIEARHLRDSGNLEQDADNILIIQMPDPDGATEASYQVEITLAKQRLGRPGYFRCRKDNDLGRFDDLPESGRYGIPIKQKKQSRFTIVGGKKSGVVNGDPSTDANEGQGMPF
jgi:replicative DNA helicase